jgi:hypothetical protein
MTTLPLSLIPKTANPGLAGVLQKLERETSELATSTVARLCPQPQQVTGTSRSCQFLNAPKALYGAIGVGTDNDHSGRPRAQVIHRPAGFPLKLLFQLRYPIGGPGTRSRFELGGHRARELGANVRARALE